MNHQRKLLRTIRLGHPECDHHPTLLRGRQLIAQREKMFNQFLTGEYGIESGEIQRLDLNGWHVANRIDD